MAGKAKDALVPFTEHEMVAGSIVAADIASGAVTAAKLATDAVETAKIKDLNVTTGKLAASAVTAAKLATDAVETAKIKDLNVTAGKLAAAVSNILGLYSMTFHIPGLLAANVASKFKTFANMKLVHVSAVASNDSDATLKLGTSADDDAYLLSSTIGDSGTPVEKVAADFVGGAEPEIAAGTIFSLALDFDGTAGTAAQDVTIVLTFRHS